MFSNHPQDDEPPIPGTGSNPPDTTADPATAAATLLLRALQQAAATVNPTSSPGTQTKVSPPTPTIGGLSTTAPGDIVAWTGGKPNYHWSGLEVGESLTPLSPGQYRPSSISASQKSHAYRVKGLTPLFKRTSDLVTFEHNLWTHLMDNGMDSITYLRDPAKNNLKMISCVSGHNRMTLDYVTSEMKSQLTRYDEYDLANDREATMLLLNSVDEELSRELRSLRSPTDPFPVVYLYLITSVRSLSIDRYNDIKNKIKATLPSQFAGEDIAAMALALRDAADELTRAGQYDHNLTLHMLENFLEGGGPGNDDYRHELRNIKEKLSKKLITVAHLDSASQDTEMARDKLTYKDICSVATERYRTQFHRSKWPPAMNRNRDSKAAPTKFGLLSTPSLAPTPITAAPNVETTVPTVAQVNALIQQALNSDKSKDTCKKCGKLGHWAKDCPDNTGKGTGKRIPLGKGGNSNNRRNPNPKNKQGNAWKRKPPGSGEGSTKQVMGRTWHWCAKCNRWSTTHGTSTHQGQTRPPNATATTGGGSATAANTAISDSSLVFSPSAWCVSFSNTKRTVSPTCFLDSGTQQPGFVALTGVVGLAWGLLLPYLPFQLVGSLLLKHWHVALALANWTWLIAWALSLGYSSRPDLTTHPCPKWVHRPGPALRKRFTRRVTRDNLVAIKKDKRYAHRHTNNPRPTSFRNVHSHSHHDLVELLQRISAFAKRIEFQRCRMLPMFDEGEGVSQRKRHHRHHRIPELTSKYRTHGTSQPGFTQSQLRTLNSPIAHAYITSSHIPPRLKTLADAMRAAFLTQAETRSVVGKERLFEVIWDSGASTSISFCKDDFVGPIRPPTLGLRLQGISKGVKVEGRGHVAWSFVDSSGTLRTLKVPALYVPKCKVRLLSTTELLGTYQGESITQLPDRLILSGTPATKGEPQLNPAVEILIDPKTNLPVGHAYTTDIGPTVFQAFNSAISTVSSANANLTEAEKELLRWHYRLGHLSFKQILFLMRTGVLAHSESTRRLQVNTSKLQHGPLCTACQYGKQRRRSASGNTTTAVKDSTGALRRNHLEPGQCVSVDHFVCSTRGRLPHTFGKEDVKKQYCGGAIFVDHASGYMFIKEQVHLNTHETIEAKQLFELHCRDYGVVPQAYQSDNGTVFTSADYTSHLTTFQQISSFAGVGAHHHNGIAERGIQTVMSIARTMLLHAAIHWPEVADAKLWPLAVQQAVFLYNHMPSVKNGLSPHDLFTKTRWPHAKFQDLHVWGCPVFVLDKAIADGHKIPRWQPRSTRQIYVGISPKHASNVPLVLNPETGAITPQFNVVFDDWFATIATDPQDLPDFASDSWNRLFGDTLYQYTMEEEPDNEVPPTSEVSDDGTASHRSRVANAFDQHLPPRPLPVVTNPNSAGPNGQNQGLVETNPSLLNLQHPSPVDCRPSSPPPFLTTPSRTLSPTPRTPLIPTATPSLQPQQREHSPPTSKAATPRPSLKAPLHASPAPPEPSNQREKEAPKAPNPPPVKPAAHPRPAHPPSLAPLRTSGRVSKPPTRYGYEGNQGRGYSAIAQTHQAADEAESTHHFTAYFVAFMEQNYPSVEFALQARKTKDPDTLTFDEAMRAADRTQWIESMNAEIHSLVQAGTWVEEPVESAQSKIVPLTWTFRRKRSPDGQLKKHKGRLCVRGDLEEKRPNQDKYSPVEAWSSVRMFLVLSLLLNWETVSIDFSSAFVQAKLKSPVWVHLPRGYTSSKGQGTCLRLIKSLYGLSIAPRLWYDHLIKALKELGFKPTTQDPCLLYKDNLLIVVYVDDTGIAAKHASDIDTLIQQLQDRGFSLTKEGSFAEFLGIKFHQQGAEFRLTQRGLIDKVVSATGLQDCKPNHLPCSQIALGSDPDGSPMSENWSYSSVVGMLLYLSTNSRPDIAFAVSQVCRFSARPMQSHATAVKTIVRYLYKTRDEGMILRPTGKLSLDLYVDADFCSLHGHEIDSDPNSARSRTGYIILLSGCPVLWKSQLQTHISCSTLEAEYSALSLSLKTLLPLKRLLIEIVNGLDIDDELRTSVCARAFEDNQGALYLATNQKITNRTKYFHTKWHWFWEHARNKEFEVVRVESKDQRADYLTKGLTRELFEHNRLLVQGW